MEIKIVDKQYRSKATNVIDIKQVKEEDIVYENHIWGLTGGHRKGYQFFVSLDGKLLQMELETEDIISVML